jgi:hypothetical protein
MTRLRIHFWFMLLTFVFEVDAARDGTSVFFDACQNSRFLG